jgi:hypothetical protein
VTQELAMRQKLALALRQAKRKPMRKEDQQPGTGTNENGPQVQTNAPANYWPTDGDS